MVYIELLTYRNGHPISNYGLWEQIFWSSNA